MENGTATEKKRCAFKLYKTDSNQERTSLVKDIE